MVRKPNKKPLLLAKEAAKVQISTSNFNIKGRQETILQLYTLIKHDPQARRYLAALLEELDQKEASA